MWQMESHQNHVYAHVRPTLGTLFGRPAPGYVSNDNNKGLNSGIHPLIVFPRHQRLQPSFSPGRMPYSAWQARMRQKFVAAPRASRLLQRAVVDVLRFSNRFFFADLPRKTERPIFFATIALPPYFAMPFNKAPCPAARSSRVVGITPTIPVLSMNFLSSCSKLSKFFQSCL